MKILFALAAAGGFAAMLAAPAPAQTTTKSGNMVGGGASEAEGCASARAKLDHQANTHPELGIEPGACSCKPAKKVKGGVITVDRTRQTCLLAYRYRATGSGDAR